jgi:acetone carboxylase gamma subunit
MEVCTGIQDRCSRLSRNFRVLGHWVYQISLFHRDYLCLQTNIPPYILDAVNANWILYREEICGLCALFRQEIVVKAEIFCPICGKDHAVGVTTPNLSPMRLT